MHTEAFVAQQTVIAGLVYELATTEPDFAPNYYDYPDALSQLLKASARLKMELKRFNKRQAEDIGLRVDLSHIHQIKLDQFDKLGIFIDFMWDEDAADLSTIFATHLPGTIAASGLMSWMEIGITIDFGPSDLPAQKFLERHVSRLAKDTTDVTRERVKNTIRQGLLAGKDREALEEDLADVFDNASRRRMIAQTESVLAFSEGRIQAEIEMGATEKRWPSTEPTLPNLRGIAWPNGADHGKLSRRLLLSPSAPKLPLWHRDLLRLSNRHRQHRAKPLKLPQVSQRQIRINSISPTLKR
jgi:hypothetical protein